MSVAEDLIFMDLLRKSKGGERYVIIGKDYKLTITITKHTPEAVKCWADETHLYEESN